MAVPNNSAIWSFGRNTGCAKNMRRSSLDAGGLVAVMALAGCTATPGAQTGSAAAPGPASTVSWDGTYRGTLHITGLGSGVQRQWCESDPQIVFVVTNNSFSYAMPHPNAPNNPTPVYSAAIASDGAFRSSIASGTMTGRVTGAHISGTINGSVCVYSFTLDRS
jgi:hypothetical protein